VAVVLMRQGCVVLYGKFHAAGTPFNMALYGEVEFAKCQA